MEIQEKTNFDYSRRKNEHSEKETRQFRIRTFRVQENIEKNKLNMLLKRNEKECKEICKRMSNLSIETNV